MDKIENSTLYTEGTSEGFQLSYRITATTLHCLIFIIGIVGNVGLIIVVYRSKTLHTPGYAYLVSLALADLIVIATAVPEAIVSCQIGKVWILGKSGCAIFVFLNFLGINAGSLSLLTFTVERYVAVCRPLLAQKICTLKRTRKIIVLCWIFACAYCTPWLGLTEAHQDPLFPEWEQCEFRLTREIYEAVFAMDLFLYYLIPLMVAIVCHAKINTALRQRTRRFSFACRRHSQFHLNTTDDALHQDQEPFGDLIIVYQRKSDQDLSTTHSEQTQRLRMLIIITIFFAVSWLPFRGLLLYNTFVQEPWLDLWYMLFAKTLIYVNCAINPFLYNVLCQRFRTAVRKMFSPK